MENTKQIIIYEALTLFSRRGYEGVSMRDIAAAVGIKAASLYKHFKSKENIFDSIISEMSERYEDAVIKMQLPGGDIDEAAEQYMHLSEDSLFMLAENLFLYFLKDDFASKFRHMLTIEQFRSPQARNAFQSFFIDAAPDYQKILFANMIKSGCFIECDPYIMALHFYSPILLLLNKYDHEPDKETEAIAVLLEHVKQFASVYKKRVLRSESPEVR